MDSDPRDKAPTWLLLAIQGLIVYSIVTTMLETMPELSRYASFFRWSDTITVALFTIEYIAFWRLADDRWRYPFRFMSLIDLLAILPFYLQFGVDLRFLRVLRLLRVFRVLKLGRYSQAMQSLGEAFRRAAPELGAFSFLATIIIVISAMALYYAEHDAQPDVYRSIPDTLWWAVVTLTTVGYGDVYPVTPTGRIIASLIMFSGIGFVAVPCSLLSATMAEIHRERRKAGNS